MLLRLQRGGRAQHPWPPAPTPGAPPWRLGLGEAGAFGFRPKRMMRGEKEEGETLENMGWRPREGFVKKQAPGAVCVVPEEREVLMREERGQNRKTQVLKR